MLGIIVIIGVGLWSGAWMYGRTVVADQMDQQLAQMAENNLEVTCRERTISGYPFRYEVRCENVELINASGQLIQLGKGRGVALVYNPWHVIVEIDGPLTVQNAEDSSTGAWISGSWELAQTSIRLGNDGLRQLDVVVSKPAFQAANLEAPADVRSDELTFHMRKVPETEADLDLYVSTKQLSGQLLPDTLPLFDTVFQLRIANGFQLIEGRSVADLPRLEDGSIPFQLSRVSLADGDSSQISVSGEMRLHRNGTLSGDLELEILGLDQISSLVEQHAPEAASVPAILKGASDALGTAETAENGAEIVRLPITLKNGNARIGFLPLGQLPVISIPGL